MRQFFKFVFASCLGMVLFVVLFVIVVSIIGASSFSSGKDVVDLKPNSIIEIKLDKSIPEKSNNKAFEFSGFSKSDNEAPGLTAIQDAIRHATTDKNIKGIVMNLQGGGMGFATASVIRAEIENFKKSGKFVMAYADAYSQGKYFISSVADKMYLHPLGMVDLKGLSSTLPFFKGLMDKIGVKAQVYYAGKFKSATEPFRLYKMSDENKYQVREFLTDLNDEMISHIAKGRKLTELQVRTSINSYDGQNAESALNAGIIDQVGFSSDMSDEIRKKLGLKKDDKLNKIDLNDYVGKVEDKKDYSTKDKIAIVYAEGDIVDGKADYGTISSKVYSAIFQKIAKDKTIKAIVLRVNSPGGSAVASESILHEIEKCKANGIPVVVSMGDYAASGGYYISCAADSIFADAVTITGSIGVFSLYPNTEILMKEKLGISYDTVKTGTFSTGFGAYFPHGKAEANIIQNSTERVYQQFLSRVSVARKMPIEKVNEIAQGRVWTGKDALRVGLVDKIGGLDQAIASAAKLAKLNKYRTTDYPKIKDPFQLIMDEFSGNQENKEEAAIKAKLGSYFVYVEQLVRLQKMHGPQMLMPVSVKLD